MRLKLKLPNRYHKCERLEECKIWSDCLNPLLLETRFNFQCFHLFFFRLSSPLVAVKMSLWIAAGEEMVSESTVEHL